MYKSVDFAYSGDSADSEHSDDLNKLLTVGLNIVVLKMAVKVSGKIRETFHNFPEKLVKVSRTFGKKLENFLKFSENS